MKDSGCAFKVVDAGGVQYYTSREIAGLADYRAQWKYIMRQPIPMVFIHPQHVPHDIRNQETGERYAE